MSVSMNMTDETRLELDRMFIRWNRILDLRRKYEKCSNEQVKKCIQKQIDNLQKQQEQTKPLLLKI